MTVSPYASEAKINEALTAIGAELIGQTEQQLLQQIVVAAATASGGGSSSVASLLLAGASAANLASLTEATAGTGGSIYGTQGGLDRKFNLTSAGAALTEAANATDQKTALGLASVQPFIVAFKNVTALTTGAPTDIATVTLPSWCTRYSIASTGSRLLAESTSGTLASASFTVRDAAAGAGNALTTAALGPASTNVTVLVSGTVATVAPLTASTLYLRQTANSGNAGVVSMYLLVTPLL